MTPLRSALFIDYDNVRSELERYDPAVASRFSNKTLLWLAALEKDLALPDGGQWEGRKIVARRCYASPQRINAYRRSFTQTGFEVVDCPPLTTHLKNSADIYIVMDVIDYLQRYPHIEEYIILSADADFVPVLNRLRKELKMSVIFTSYNTTAAYRNCADRTLEADFFARHLAIEAVAPRAMADLEMKRRGTAPAPSAAPAAAAAAAAADPALSEAIEACLIEAAQARSGHLPFSAAAGVLRRRFEQEIGTNWAGHRTFTAFIDALSFKVLEIDHEGHALSNPDFKVELPEWSEEERDLLQEFVSDVAWSSAKPLPILRPGEFRIVFERLAAHFRSDEVGTFTEAIAAVTAACERAGVEVSANDIRFIATNISIQQYRFDEGRDAAHLASLWRLQVFDLCGEPDWMRDPDEAALLIAWCHADGESPDEAREAFLSATADAPEEPAPSE